MPESTVPPETPERGARPLERVADALEQRGVTTAVAAHERAATTSATDAPVVERPRAVIPKTPLREDVETALADGLEEIYAALPTATQAVFRDRGEQLAARMDAMVASGTIELRDAYRAVTAWLRLLPSAGKFFHAFLDQEAKVKMDALLAIVRRQT